MKYIDLFVKVAHRKTRSAWERGVRWYALDLLDRADDSTPSDVPGPDELEKTLLNGADNWQRYSEGGCAFIDDRDIATRLCSPSELRKVKGGEKAPNSRESWIDVQARALYQANALIQKLAR